MTETGPNPESSSSPAYVILSVEAEDPVTPDGAKGRARMESQGVIKTVAAANTPPISGLLVSTWTDAWTYCKATSKYVGAHHWVPWLGGATAVLSAITATEIFTSLQNEEFSITARVLVGVVMVLATAITALQAWTGSRIKALNDQANAFHKLHRKIQRDIETHAAGSETYVNDVETELRGIMASMVSVSNAAWDHAKADVILERDTELERLGVIPRRPTKS